MTHEHDDMVSRERAVADIQDLRTTALDNQGTEHVDLADISGRILAEPIDADRDVPAYDHATMDGFAFDATEDYPLTVTGDDVYPENEPARIDSGEAVRLATGAPLPERANAVLKREDANVEDGQLTGPKIEPGTYVYERASNVAAGERLFHERVCLSAKDAILLGDLGIDRVPVLSSFSAGILATGTEIHEGVSRDLDSDMLAALVQSWGHHAVYEGTVPDEYERVRDRIETLAAEHDVIITTGGTSVGHKDYVIRALDELGGVLFHRVRVRPGKPIAAAQLKDAVVFAIPGKPIGAHTIATLVMRPFFTGDDDLPTIRATVTADVDLGPEGFEYVIPVLLNEGEATPMGHPESPLSIYQETFDPSVVSSSTRATRADGFIVTQTPLEGGSAVSVTPYGAVE